MKGIETRVKLTEELKTEVSYLEYEVNPIGSLEFLHPLLKKGCLEQIEEIEKILNKIKESFNE